MEYYENYAVVVEGAFLVGDSIAMDAILQYRILQDLFGQKNVTLFAASFSTKVYVGVDFTPYEAFDSWVAANPTGVVIYHFCDGWLQFEERLLSYEGRKIVRWHNNTPPWFYARQPSALRGTIRGLRSVIELVSRQKLEVWANSEFSVRQLKILTNGRQRVHCVFPASAYLEASGKNGIARRRRPLAKEGDPLRLLFVGRVVIHKGHKHVIAVADLIARVRNRRVRVDFVGRRDENALVYNASLEDMTQAARCEVFFHGGLPQDELDRHYDSADVFVCLSEHEGFGLPAFEAMRRDVPVVAWANTAYEDLLAESPLAFHGFDLSNFAAAVEIAATPAYKKHVDAIQDVLLAKYTRRIVSSQVLSGLGLNLDASTLPPPAQGNDISLAKYVRRILPSQVLSGLGLNLDASTLPPPAQGNDISEATAELKKAVSRLSDMYRLSEEEVTGLQSTHDFTGNYISAYDVESFDYLLNTHGAVQKLFEVLGSNGNETLNSVRIIPQAFLSKIGAWDAGVFRFSQIMIEGGHLIYGPYLNMPAGRFGFRFDLKLSYYKPTRPFLVEVVAYQQVVATREVTWEGESCDAYVEFEFLTPQADVELRISVMGRAEFSGTFHGVLVERLRSVASLTPAIQTFSYPEQFGRETKGTVLYLPASSFMTLHGKVRQDRLEIEIAKPSGEHLFFGPYIEIPKGRYQIAINLKLWSPVEALHLEIAASGVLVSRDEVQLGDDGRIVLEKEVTQGLERGEFRLCAESDVPLHATFYGIEIKRLPSLATLLIEGKVYTPQGVQIVADNGRSVFFEPFHFVSQFAETANDRLIFPAQVVPGGVKLIYGPYVAVPKGRFRIKFHFNFIRFETNQPVEIDVADEGRMITYRRLEAGALDENTIIDCEFLSPVDRCEFRFSPIGEASVLGYFKGVSVERLPALSGLKAATGLKAASSANGR